MQIAEEKKDRLEKMKKTEQQMEQVFEMKVKEKMNQLKESESDVCIMCDLLLHSNQVSLIFSDNIL